jgi:hypothetical protein
MAIVLPNLFESYLLSHCSSDSSWLASLGYMAKGTQITLKILMGDVIIYTQNVRFSKS